MINKEEFIRHLTEAVESLELPPLTEEQLAALVIYYERVVTLNESINLTALTSPEDFAVKNVADSLTAIDDELFKQLRKKRNGHRLKYIDVGTGAGLPGVILSIMRPELTVTLPPDVTLNKDGQIELQLELRTFPQNVDVTPEWSSSNENILTVDQTGKVTVIGVGGVIAVLISDIVSDWMDIEKERGISVTSSVLQFNYDGFCIK